jgi:hypothetical protein
LTTLAARNGTSKARKTAVSGSACQSGYFKRTATTEKSSSVVISMVETTAMP